MHPSQILDAHVDLSTRLEGWELRDLMAKTAGFAVHNDSPGMPSPEERGEQLVHHLRQNLKISYDYQVTEDMVDLLDAAAHALTNEDVMDWTLAPTDAGLVRFEKPIQIALVDAGNETGENAFLPLEAEWMAWGPMTPDEDGRKRIGTYWFMDPRGANPIAANFRESTGDDETAAQIMACMGQWLWVGCDLHVAGAQLDYGLGKDLQFRAGGEYPSDEYGADREELDAARLHTGKILLALWLMLNQTIVETEDPNLERPTRRRAKKMGIPDRVTVIRLRRHVRPDSAEGESQVEWSHRWMVRGHWRWQAHGEGRKERTRIWVAPHVKGPDDKPLIITDKLYRLER